MCNLVAYFTVQIKYITFDPYMPLVSANKRPYWPLEAPHVSHAADVRRHPLLDFFALIIHQNSGIHSHL